MAAVVLEDEVSDRFTRLESDVAHMSSQISEMKIDIREIRGDVGKLRSELFGTKGEFHAEFAAVRAEMSGMKDEFRAEFGSVRSEIARLDGKIDRKSLADRLWMTLIMGSMIASLFGAMAHGFKWI